jgi:prophage antirepressor-like protein
MNNLIPFQFNQREIRTVQMDGEPMFIAKDVADVLGYKNPSRAINTHCKGVQTCPTISVGQVRHVQAIPERDVYRLVMRSKMPEAEAFEEWVVGEVLTSIRKTGSYKPELPKPLSRAEILQMALEAENERIRLEDKVTEIQPKADALDRISSADGSQCITDAAKALQMRPKDLFSWLHEHHWIYRRTGNSHWCGRSEKLQQGLLEHKVTLVTRTDGSERTTEQVRITAKGLAKLSRLISGDAIH